MQAFQKNTSFIFPNLKGKFVLPNQDFLSIVTILSSKSVPPISHFHCWSRLASKCVQICFTDLMLTCLRWMGACALLRRSTVAQAAYIEQQLNCTVKTRGKVRSGTHRSALGSPTDYPQTKSRLLKNQGLSAWVGLHGCPIWAQTGPKSKSSRVLLRWWCLCPSTPCRVFAVLQLSNNHNADLDRFTPGLNWLQILVQIPVIAHT